MNHTVFFNIMLCSIFFYAQLSANNLNITGFSVNQAAQTVTFTLSWDNSWRDSENWDAAWVFIKWRQCNVPLATTWDHGLISTTLSDHTFPADFEPTQSDGTAPGIDAATNNTGVMIRRTSTGFGTVTGTITLRVTNLPTSGDYDFRIFGIEMVFIPQGSFYAGDQASSYFIRVSTTVPSPKQFTSEASTTLTDNTSANYTLTANFRKGYSAFYIMKYEISQGQYTDFLNTLGQTQASSRFPNQFNVNRNRIQQDAMTFTYSCDRPDRAMNFLYWNDTWSYLDWAALRPLTELEFEKACRGPLAPIPFEFPWGSITYVYGTTLSGAENGTETFTNANANLKALNQTITGGDGGTGPCRVGIFATPTTTTRQAAGASYWGVLNLADNVAESYFGFGTGVAGGTPGSNVIQWGDGLLNASGLFTNTEWNCGAGGALIRGYVTTTDVTLGYTSARYYSNSSISSGRDYRLGGRGGR